MKKQKAINDSQMAIAAILEIENSGFPPLMINIYSDESSRSKRKQH
jgi:hypothetical protein